MTRSHVFTALTVLAVACGGQTTTDDSLSSKTGASTGGAVDRDASSDSSTASAGPACAWSLPHYEANAPRNEACAAGRAYVECKRSDGTTSLGMSDDPTKSPFPSPGLQSTCRNLCDTATEYAVQCGAEVDATLPASCRSVGYPATGGAKSTSWYCCPCL